MINIIFEDGKYKVKIHGTIECDKARSIEDVKENFDVTMAYEFNEGVRRAFTLNAMYSQTNEGKSK